MNEIIANKKRCASIRQCVSVAPEFFGIDPVDSRVQVLRSTVDEADFELADEAVSSCPMEALLLQRADGE